ncbi:uncharacterized protein LOC107304761 [Oryza brachyantha]|uniref:uncharacterized protein LOC107304761 n=1 Tax=Oryza brachyantha TaxID=4533 RepID=UPI0007760005|nr:uncharacterized protein LOC107304761 [Oryza brachyantha]
MVGLVSCFKNQHFIQPLNLLRLFPTELAKGAQCLLIGHQPRSFHGIDRKVLSFISWEEEYVEEEGDEFVDDQVQVFADEDPAAGNDYLDEEFNAARDLQDGSN